MKWGFFTPAHLLTLVLAAAMLTALYYGLRNKSQKIQTMVLLPLSLSGVAAIVFNLLHWGSPLEYLPLHLCSINIILIAIHAWKPNKTLDNFLYGVCIPGALAAMLFSTWTPLPTLNFMHLHSFTIHILLIAYPVMLTVGGDIRPDWRVLPKCLLLTLCMAVPIYCVNLALDTNFMFLMYADEGNPLLLFEQMFGSHLWGFPVLGTVFVGAMYGVLYLCRKVAGEKNTV